MERPLEGETSVTSLSPAAAPCLGKQGAAQLQICLTLLFSGHSMRREGESPQRIVLEVSVLFPYPSGQPKRSRPGGWPDVTRRG